MQPKVLISDALSPAAVQIFKDRGIEVEFQPNLGKDKDKLAAIIGDFDGLAIRSATKVTAKILETAKDLKVIGRAGIGVDNVDIPAATAQGHHRDEHAVRQLDHDGRACDHADAGACAPDPAGRRLHPGRQVGEEPVHGRRDHRQDARHHRLRQHRLDRGRARARPAHEGDRLRSVSCRPSARSTSASRRSSWTTCCGAPTSSRCTRRSPRRPRTSSTRRALAKTKKGVRIINCARGGLVDEAALRAALDSGQVAGAAFDVFTEEPATRTRCSATPTWCARRTSAPPPWRRRRTSLSRWPSRCPTICCAAPSPMR